jgi:hypothetical protein
MWVLVPTDVILFFVRKTTWMWRMWKMQEQFSAKEKYPKEIRPMPLASCALAFLSGFAKRYLPFPLAKRGFLAAPSGWSRKKRQCSAQHTGTGDCRSIVRWITTVWTQEVGGKMLLHFPHSPHPCGLAMQEQLPRRAKSLNFHISKDFPRVVIHQSETPHIRWVTPRMNAGNCLDEEYARLTTPYD